MAVETLVNVVKEKEIVNEIIQLYEYYQRASLEEKKVYAQAIRSLLSQLKILSQTVSELIEHGEKVDKKIVQRITMAKGDVFVDKKIKKDFLEQVGIGENALSKLKSKPVVEIKADEEFRKPGFLVSFASSIFHGLASNLMSKDYFDGMKTNLKKANMPYLASSYLSLSFLIALFVLIISLGFAIGLSSMATLVRNIVIALAVSVVAFLFAINYPALMVSSSKNKLDDELAFAVSHVSAIASSQVEPSRIFGIMSKVKDYPLFAKESKKVVNQMNVYGYDFVTALKNVASTCSSEKLAELFLGIATSTKTGGSLVKYLEEKSKDLLVDYRLRRQKYSELVSMLSDIYTALLIAAPLILMLILAIMSVVGSSFGGMSIPSLATIGLVVIIALNIIFIFFIQITQPKT